MLREEGTRAHPSSTAHWDGGDRTPCRVLRDEWRARRLGAGSVNLPSLGGSPSSGSAVPPRDRGQSGPTQPEHGTSDHLRGCRLQHGVGTTVPHEPNRRPIDVRNTAHHRRPSACLGLDARIEPRIVRPRTSTRSNSARVIRCWVAGSALRNRAVISVSASATSYKETIGVLTAVASTSSRSSRYVALPAYSSAPSGAPSGDDLYVSQTVTSREASPEPPRSG